MPQVSNKIKVGVASLIVSAAGLLFIQQQEGTKLKSYDDGLNIQTICVGHTKGVTKGMTTTLEQCQVWLKEDVGEAGKAVARWVKVPITQSQYDALVSFTFNLGVGALQKSNLLKKINAGQCKEAGTEFLKWDKGRINGKLTPMKGLTKRRQAESKMWLEGCE